MFQIEIVQSRSFKQNGDPMTDFGKKAMRANKSAVAGRG
jgi:hypothetical protein